MMVLDEENSRHAISVLRMKKGDELLLTDGRGKKTIATINSDHKKACTVLPGPIESSAPSARSVTIAISLLKNASRFEWFLEKATEIGVREIIPLICERTEREKFRQERMYGILISAMLQSQQSWLPVLQKPTSFEQVIQNANQQTKLVAHCEDTGKSPLSSILPNSASDPIILIGPEGDFTRREIEHAKEQGFLPVSMGNTRLRTETAGMAAAALLCL